MKKIFAVMAGALALATFGLSASAADLAKPVYKAPPAPVYAPPVVNTDGFFIQGDAGYFSGGFKVNDVKYDMNSYLIGGQIGYQWSGWRFGVVADYIGGSGTDFASIGGGPIVSCGGCPGGSTVVGAFTNYQATDASAYYIGARVTTPGYAVTPDFVLRAFGGLGYAETSVDLQNYTNLRLDPPLSLSFNTPVTKGSISTGGFAWEVGAEVEIFKYVVVSGGYLGMSGNATSDYNGTTKVSADGGWFAKGGLNYKF